MLTKVKPNNATNTYILVNNKAPLNVFQSHFSLKTVWCLVEMLFKRYTNVVCFATEVCIASDDAKVKGHLLNLKWHRKQCISETV